MNTDNFDPDDDEQFETTEQDPVKLPNGVLHSKYGHLRYLNMREMTGNEEEILTTRKYGRDGSAIRRILENCVTGFGPSMREAGMIEGEDIYSVLKEMRLSDALFTLVKLRILSEEDDTFRYSLKCPKCGDLGRYHVKLKEYLEKNTEYMPDGEQPQSTYTHKDEKGVEYVYRPLLIQDNAELAHVQRTEPHMTLTAQLACSLLRIGKREYRTMREVSDLPKKVRTKLRRLINECDYGMDVEVMNNCNECNHEFKGNLPIASLDFFFPEANDS